MWKSYEKKIKSFINLKEKKKISITFFPSLVMKCIFDTGLRTLFSISKYFPRNLIQKAIFHAITASSGANIIKEILS